MVGGVCGISNNLIQFEGRDIAINVGKFWQKDLQAIQ